MLRLGHEVGDDAEEDAPADRAAEHRHGEADGETLRTLREVEVHAASGADALADSKPRPAVASAAGVGSSADGRLQQLGGGADGGAHAERAGLVHMLQAARQRG